MIGRTVGKYRVIDRLGRGGMGTVYRAVDETLDREVAIKVLNSDLEDSDVLKRFRAEAVTLGRLNHPGIATLYELHRDDDDLLMVMEFVRGETFHDLSDRLGPLAAPQAAHLCMQVLDALAHAHRAGVVHRDLKPANLMVSETGTVKVMDFGIARVLGTEHFTHGGYMMGTPAYMAPEQVMGREVDARADLYAIGVVFYRLLSGRLPFEADTAIAMVQKQIAEAPAPISAFRPDLPEWCGQVIDRALAKAPADRFQSAEEFRTALRLAGRAQALGELPTMAATPTPTGLLVDPEITLAHDPVGSSASRDRPSSVALATPPTQARTNGGPAPAPAGSPSTPPLERTTGTTVVLGRTHLVAIAALLVVLAAGIGVLGFAAMRRESFAQQLPLLGTLPQPSPPDATPENQAAVETEETSAPPVTLPAPPAPAARSTPGVAATAGAGSTQSAGTTTVPARDAGSGATRADSAPVETARPTVTTEDAAEPATAPVVVFDDVRVIVTDPGSKGRERDAVLQFGNDRISVLESVGGPSIASLPYKDVLGAFYSRSRQPKWKDAEGNEVEAKVDLGRLGFFRGDRSWLILLTRSEPLIVRIHDPDVKTVLPAITAHTGIAVQR